ncbi:MAG TPA: hypothetical protein VLN59_15555 [Burkholderiales bacterium]|nr:hypothetical protein [Burkholderiales bacterium]
MAAALVIALGTVRVMAADSGIVKGTALLPPGTNSAADTVIYLEGRIGTPSPKTVTIDQRDHTFLPHVVALARGGTVEFLNSDPVLHNVYSASAVQRFDLGMFGRGERRSVKFDTPGVVELRCNVHPDMRAYVLVLENNYFATADENGNFQISGVPAGRYKVRAWHEGLPVAETWANLDDASIRTVELRWQQ